MSEDFSDTPQWTSNDLMDRQAQLLEELRQTQAVQQAQLEELMAEQRALGEVLDGLQVVPASRPLAVYFDSASEVKIANINIPFWSLVRFLIKIAFAAIPAYIILGLLALIIGAIIGAATGTMPAFQFAP